MIRNIFLYSVGLVFITGCGPLPKDPLVFHTIPEVPIEERDQMKDRLEKAYNKEKYELEQESLLEKNLFADRVQQNAASMESK
jgi:hypothetical protein